MPLTNNRIQITSDGTPRGTRIIFNDIDITESCRGIAFSHGSPAEVPVVALDLAMCEVVIDADVRTSYTTCG